MSTFHLHIGINAASRLDLIDITTPSMNGISDTGEQWERWGEHASATDARHIVILTSTPMITLGELANTAWQPEPMLHPQQRGTIAVATLADDWLFPIVVTKWAQMDKAGLVTPGSVR